MDGFSKTPEPANREKEYKSEIGSNYEAKNQELPGRHILIMFGSWHKLVKFGIGKTRSNINGKGLASIDTCRD